MPLPFASFDPHGLDRRAFLHSAGVAAAGVALGGLAPADAVAARFSAFGIIASIARSAELKAAGAQYLVERTSDYLMPTAAEADFEAATPRLTASALPVRGVNVFLPRPELRCLGPDAAHPAILAHAEIVFRRLHTLKGEYVSFGSGGARRMPDGWTKAQADEQFISLLKALAPLAEKYSLTLAVEQLRAQETNYLNRLAEVVAVVKAVNHPKVRVLADLYHMGVMGDGPEELGATAPFLAMVEIAEKEGRMVPGVHGDDFRPYFKAIAAAGYAGPISIEGNGTIEQITKAFQVIADQAKDAV